MKLVSKYEIVTGKKYLEINTAGECTVFKVVSNNKAARKSLYNVEANLMTISGVLKTLWFTRVEKADRTTFEITDEEFLPFINFDRIDSKMHRLYWKVFTTNLKEEFLKRSEELKAGDHVQYTRKGYNSGGYSKGIIKSVKKGRAFVVYKCAGDWLNYKLYTGVGTSLKDLILTNKFNYVKNPIKLIR